MISDEVYSCGWDIIHACNYRCPYCFFLPSWETHGPETNQRHLECAPADWLRFWERSFQKYGRFYIEIAGGEPFCYPEFILLIQRISAWHRIRIVTNLSTPVEEILRLWDPRAVALSASFHPHHAERGEFIAKLKRLKERGFGAMASVVAYPPVFETLPEIKRTFEAEGISCFLNPFQGVYEGRPYPQAYSPEQSSYLRAEAAAEALEYRMRAESPRGRLCAAGRTYFRVWPNGLIYRCCPATEIGEKPMGHIKDPDFQLLAEPAPCPADRCFAPNEIKLLL